MRHRVAGLLIGGREIETASTSAIHSPYSGELVGIVPSCQPHHVTLAFEVAARKRFDLSRYERKVILETISRRLSERKAELATLISSESGLCLKDSSYEIDRAANVFELAAALVIQDNGREYAGDVIKGGAARQIYSRREPLRAISAITPFNHPINQVAHKVAPSIATNNCMVLKPSEKTPLSAFALASIAYEAGLPPEMLTIITGDPRILGDEMITNSNAELISFTGSYEVGTAIASQAGYRRTVLELGGNDPLIVLPDADIEKAAQLAVTGSFKNSGQRCTAVKRIFVADEIADQFVAKLTSLSMELTAGDPLSPDTDVGTVITASAAEVIEQRVSLAIDDGAELKCGHRRDGALYHPTVLDHVKPSSALVQLETFGPVAPVIRFGTREEAVGLINSAGFGLSSGLCTNNWEQIQFFVRHLSVGNVNVWEVPGYRTEHSPFGGIGKSGLGVKEGLTEAMNAFTNVKTYSLPWHDS